MFGHRSRPTTEKTLSLRPWLHNTGHCWKVEYRLYVIMQFSLKRNQKAAVDDSPAELICSHDYTEATVISLQNDHCKILKLHNYFLYCVWTQAHKTRNTLQGIFLLCIRQWRHQNVLVILRHPNLQTIFFRPKGTRSNNSFCISFLCKFKNKLYISTQLMTDLVVSVTAVSYFNKLSNSIKITFAPQFFTRKAIRLCNSCQPGCVGLSGLPMWRGCCPCCSRSWFESWIRWLKAKVV